MRIATEQIASTTIAMMFGAVLAMLSSARQRVE